MSSANFSESGFIRSGGAISFQERGVQPGDFTRERGFNYAQEYAILGSFEFSQKYPNWQSFADCFTLRRAVVSITGKQQCRTISFHANDLEKYAETGFVNIKNFRIPGSDRSSVPGGKYQLVNTSFRDEGNSITSISVQYMQYGKWELVKLQSETPSPRGS